MKFSYGKLFTDLFILVIIPLIMLFMGVGTWFKVKDLEFEWFDKTQLATENLGEYTWETSVVHYILDVEYEMKINQEWNTLAISYIFLGAMEGIVIAFVFKNFKNERYFEVE